MDSKSFKHYYPDCKSNDYTKGECKECKAKKMREYLASDVGKRSREKTAAKQRLNRRTTRIKEVAESLRNDVEILGINEDCSKELDQICELIQKICSVNIQDRREKASPKFVCL